MRMVAGTRAATNRRKSGTSAPSAGVGWNGVYLAEVARLSPPGMASTMTGGTLAITFFGVIFGPALFGAISGVADSYRVGFAALGVMTALCFVLLVRDRLKA